MRIHGNKQSLFESFQSNLNEDEEWEKLKDVVIDDDEFKRFKDTYRFYADDETPPYYSTTWDIEKAYRELKKYGYTNINGRDVDESILDESVKKPSEFLARDWKKLQDDPQIGAKEHWSDAYFHEVEEYGKSKSKDDISINTDENDLHEEEFYTRQDYERDHPREIISYDVRILSGDPYTDKDEPWHHFKTSAERYDYVKEFKDRGWDESLFSYGETYKSLKPKDLHESTNNKEWEEICKEFCKQIGAELIFVNDDNFGYMDKEGTMIHMYADELQKYLQNKLNK